MKRILFTWLFTAVVMLGVKAQSNFGVTGKIDFVSDYIWRGAYQHSGFSVQSALGLSYKNLSLTAISLKANKELKLSETFSLPVSVQAIAAPAYDKAYLIGGFGFVF